MPGFLVLLPLALTMNLGPGILTAIILLTGKKPINKTLLYLAGITIGLIAMGLIAFLIFDSINASGTATSQSTQSRVIDYVLAGLLAVLGVWVFTQRKKARKPKWMASIQDASSKRIFTMGLLFYSIFPSDFVILLTAGQYLGKHKLPFYHMVPFFALTLFIAAIPVLSFLLFRKRAELKMPGVQDWLDSHGWIVNEVVLVFFILLTLFG
jgi:threonine/homoserine/homoserine lactone efflux protein